MCLVAAALLAGSTEKVVAQGGGHVFLPPTRGATVLSANVDAQARLFVGMGDFMEHAAIARKLHAEASSLEMDNAVKWVETYFKKRELNRAYRLKENPLPLDALKKREDQYKKRINEFPEESLKGDPSNDMNKLLDKLATTSLAYEAIYGSDDQFSDSTIDHSLTSTDVRHILLTDGGRRDGQRMTFRANDAKVLSEAWPVVFRAPEFLSVRSSYEEVRNKVLSEIQDQHELSYVTWIEMQKALDMLTAELIRKYPKEHRINAPFKEWQMYYSGRQFLKAQASVIYRAMKTNQLEAFDGSYRFTGDSVFDLIRHMCRRGLQFAKPEAGDEPTYYKIFIGMRHVYLQLYPNDLPT
jgi:hypothetical protein